MSARAPVPSCRRGAACGVGAQGCAFLPASGNYNNGDWNNGGNNGNYWSSTENDENNAYNLNFNDSNLNPENNDNKSDNYYSVRLVRASKRPKMAADGTVHLLLQSTREQAQHA